MTDLNNKRILVLGAGREGSSAARFIYRTFPNARITVADRREPPFAETGIETRFGSACPTTLQEWDLVVVSPGVPPTEPLLQTAQAVTTATNLFMEHVQGTVIGITGSKGKSTTASLIAHILSTNGRPAHLVGNIGHPALDALETANRSDDIFVFEMSSYQTRLLEQGPDIAVITSLFPDHIDYHGSVEQYYTDKLRIAMIQKDDQVLCYNTQNTDLTARLQDAPAKRLTWGTTDGFHEHGNIAQGHDQPLLPVDEMPLPGAHNLSNILGAATVCHQLGLTHEEMQQGLRSFTPLPHRLETVGTQHGVQYVNDSLATTPEATIAALEATQNVTVLLLGGTDRGYDFSELGTVIANSSVRHIVHFPESGPTIEQAIIAAGGTQTFFATTQMGEAVRNAAQHARDGESCLLSCAAPSFSLFNDYADRGDQFRTAVQALAL